MPPASVSDVLAPAVRAARVEATATATAQEGGGGIFAERQAEVRARQPRDDEPVLRPDQVRRRGRASCSAARTSGRVRNANVAEMVNAMNTAITGSANGIGVCLVDKTAFNEPTDAALKARSRSLPTTPTRPRTAAPTSGQDLFLSGRGDGQAHWEQCRATWRCSSPRRARRTSSRGSTTLAAGAARASTPTRCHWRRLKSCR